jgi:CheY-like chemotaxis protein
MVRLIFTVSDSGRGIKKEDINKLFTKFQRLDEEKNQTIEGTGLGLAITKQLIEMMNGKVVVDSVYGEGSKFTFILDQKISNAELEDTTARIDVVADLTGKRVLVVDDNKLNLKVATKLLKTYGVDITLCNSGPECIGLIDDGNKFDLILLDDMMPGMSGIDTLHELKNMSSFNIPTIALTANAINGMKEKYLEAGFDDYLAKPIDRYELNAALVRFLNPVSSYEADSEISNPPKEEKKDNTPVEETREEVVENTSTTTNNPSIPKYVPDNAPIVVLPGDMQKSSEVQEETSNETTTDNDNKDSKILLIVDDNNLNIKVESKLITSLGYEVESANSGIEAINKVKSGKYDLIFMDIMMPMMDGVQTLHELKKINGFNTPVVALTADAVLGAKEKYLSEGFDLYVTKPADKEELQEVLDKFNV